MCAAKRGQISLTISSEVKRRLPTGPRTNVIDRSHSELARISFELIDGENPTARTLQ